MYRRLRRFQRSICYSERWGEWGERLQSFGDSGAELRLTLASRDWPELLPAPTLPPFLSPPLPPIATLYSTIKSPFKGLSHSTKMILNGKYF